MTALILARMFSQYCHSPPALRVEARQTDDGHVARRRRLRARRASRSAERLAASSDPVAADVGVQFRDGRDLVAQRRDLTDHVHAAANCSSLAAPAPARCRSPSRG